VARLLIRRRRPSLSTVTVSFSAADNSAGGSFLRADGPDRDDAYKAMVWVNCLTV
jgi:hypothetical protein